MRRATKWRPWQFSLRFVLLLTTVVAVGAGFFGWQARQLEPQRRAVTRIVELGGAVELERRGWLEAIGYGFDFDEVVNVELPLHRIDDSALFLNHFPALRSVGLHCEWFKYRGDSIGAFDGYISWDKNSDHVLVDKNEAEIRCARLANDLPGVDVHFILPDWQK